MVQSGYYDKRKTINPKLSLSSPPYEQKERNSNEWHQANRFFTPRNYFGAVRNYVRMQEEYECFFMVADLHSLTTHPDTKELKQNVHQGFGRKYCLRT